MKEHLENSDNQEQTHKEVFKNIRNYLAGRFIGATRDRALLEEVVKCFFCKYYLDQAEYNLDQGIDQIKLAKVYRETFGELKKKFPYVFGSGDEIQLDPASIHFVNAQLELVDLDSASRDPFGDLYEVFVGTGIREEEGQFFTPQNGVELLVQLINPSRTDKVIDPAAGAGGFLSSTAKHLMKLNVSGHEIAQNIYGVEKDTYLAKLAATRVAMMCFSQPQIFNADSLSWLDSSGKKLKTTHSGYFDVVLTNPPFGKNIVSTTKELQQSYDLGYDWKLDAGKTEFVKGNKLLNSVPPQVLFVERCLQLLKSGGRLGMVVPESLITSKQYSHVVQYLLRRGHFESVLGMPEDFFKTSGKGGTHTKACLITYVKEREEKSNKIFMAEAKWCGHDSRGRMIEQDDLPLILENNRTFRSGEKLIPSKLGYSILESSIESNILSPRYYNPEVKSSLEQIEKTHDIVKFGDLVKSGVVELKTGNEVGKLAYGTGTIPFVRTSDISSWEIKIDPKHGVSEEVYNMYADKQNVREGDILMVKDGTYLIGTCAIVSKYDERIVYQSHLYKIRVVDDSVISPFLLLASLSSEPVQQQIKSKRFTQDIIDSLGNRINDLLIPIPKSKETRERIIKNVKKVVRDRVESRELARKACLEVASAELSLV